MYFESHATYSSITFSFLNLAQTWNLWSATIFHGSVILLRSFVIHKYFSKFLSLHDFANPASLFIYSQLNSDLSIMFLHEVHFWGIFYWYFASFNKHCYKDRKKDRRISPSHYFVNQILEMSLKALVEKLHWLFVQVLQILMCAGDFDCMCRYLIKVVRYHQCIDNLQWCIFDVITICVKGHLEYLSIAGTA